ncbi:MAG: hypothetical protein ACRD2Q_02380 [Terriglobales bacterium]
MKQGTMATTAAVVSSVLALSCCLPLGFLGAAGAAGAAVYFKSAQPWLLVLAAGFLCLGFYQTYRPASCGIERSRMGVILLWAATVLVAVIAFFPQVIAGWLADLLG